MVAAVFIITFLLFLLIAPFFTVLAWNCFMPLVLPTIPHLTYWAAVSLHWLLMIVRGGSSKTQVSEKSR